MLWQQHGELKDNVENVNFHIISIISTDTTIFEREIFLSYFLKHSASPEKEIY